MELTIQRLLGEKKRLSQRIQKQIQELQVAGIKYNQRDKVNRTKLTKEQFISKSKADMQSIEKLIENLNKIEVAINIANATTTLVFKGKEITLIEAIKIRDNNSLTKKYIDKLISQHEENLDEYEYAQAEVEREVDQQISSMLGKDGDVNSKSIIAIRKQILDEKSIELVCDNMLKERIDTLSELNTDDMAELNSLISEANSVTKVNINLD